MVHCPAATLAEEAGLEWCECTPLDPHLGLDQRRRSAIRWPFIDPAIPKPLFTTRCSRAISTATSGLTRSASSPARDRCAESYRRLSSNLSAAASKRYIVPPAIGARRAPPELRMFGP